MNANLLLAIKCLAIRSFANLHLKHVSDAGSLNTLGIRHQSHCRYAFAHEWNLCPFRLGSIRLAAIVRSFDFYHAVFSLIITPSLEVTQKHIGYKSWNDDFEKDTCPELFRVTSKDGVIISENNGVVEIEAPYYSSKTDAAEANGQRFHSWAKAYRQ